MDYNGAWEWRVWFSLFRRFLLRVVSFYESFLVWLGLAWLGCCSLQRQQASTTQCENGEQAKTCCHSLTLKNLHMMIELSPSYSISQLVRRLKQTTNNALWKNHDRYLRKKFWLERTFWSDGYFASSIRNASIETFQAYIRNQG